MLGDKYARKLRILQTGVDDLHTLGFRPHREYRLGLWSPANQVCRTLIWQDDGIACSTEKPTFPSDKGGLADFVGSGWIIIEKVGYAAVLTVCLPNAA